MFDLAFIIIPTLVYTGLSFIIIIAVTKSHSDKKNNNKRAVGIKKEKEMKSTIKL